MKQKLKLYNVKNGKDKYTMKDLSILKLSQQIAHKEPIVKLIKQKK